jgi:hypothetical protein
MSITRREFERQYGADLLSSSMANYALGDIWDYEYILFLFSRHLVYKADNIANIINVDGLYEELQNQPLVNALMPDIDFTSDIKVGTAINIPSLQNFDLATHINHDSVIKFSFGKVKGKSITPLRKKITNGLDRLKQTDFSRYKHTLRSYEVVSGFFYSDSVILKVDKNISDTASLKTDFLTKGIDFNTTIDASNHETITINSSECPFAAQFISGRNL